MSDYDDAADRAKKNKKDRLEHLIVGAEVTGGIYRPLPVSEQPDIKLERWCVWELPDGDHHFMGSIPWADGRVSSKIVQFDHGRSIGVTRSGRRYELIGPPGTSADGQYVWAMWCRGNGLKPDEAVNVSDKYFNKKRWEAEVAEFRAKHRAARSDEVE